MKAYLETYDSVLEEQDSDFNGISSQEAARRLGQFGKNRLKEGKHKNLLQRFLKQLVDPMIIILIAAAVVSAITAAYSGESFADVIIIVAVVLINAVLGVVQENKAEQAIAALQEIAAATSKVLRDGQQHTVRSEELVPGDVIILEAGDSVPADARLLECASMKAEEAALTGESVPVNKTADPLTCSEQKDIPLGDRKNMAYMGSTIVYGRGRAVVTGTGMNTEMGKIADALDKAQDGETPLQIKLNQLSRILSFVVIGICAFIFALDIIRSYPDITFNTMIDTFMVAVSLAVAAIPEGLATVVTIVLSMGVTKMSRQNAVIRRLTAVETLGCTQIICSDKTGTLTQNKMTVVEHRGDDEALLARAMALCSDAQLDEKNEAIGEPTECALVNYAYSVSLSKNELNAQMPRIGEAPFDSQRKMMSTIHKDTRGSVIQFTKGAPDEVLKRCTHLWKNGEIIPLTDPEREHILQQNKDMADRALRVLCAAMRIWSTPPAAYDSTQLEQDLCYIGLTGMIDPIRPEVKDAIAKCRSAGIRPIMITGDHKDTAVAIAKQLGIIKESREAVTGAELNDITDENFREKIKEYSVYARVQPEHKVRIVNTWRELGFITAMTGDGVNDAPSIKNADIGVGMGITGTDVTKNVADMVLADDNFATIVNAVAEGRRIYDNIRKSIQFLLSANLSEVISIFVATLLGFTVLKPVHLLWVNLITDCFPALALGMEKEESNIMKRPPRNAKEGIFAGGMGFDVIAQGIIITIITLTAYFIGHYVESGRFEITTSADGITMAFLSLSMAEIFHSFNMRSRRESVLRLKRQNIFIWGAMILSFLCTTAVIYIPFLSDAFGFEHISLMEYGIAMLLAFSIIPIIEIIKLIQRMIKK
ncbi:calcium-translocating P-type ATPase, PMCA-type [Ruminococcus sp. OA3]|uniref:calcium-translocating P-type ATPase, PMCA-type n=1 Tax=Ruminococcus sp. OA3 TaxID=2914164 RepID=UPI001F06788F|nr:calcium-translocating P-type ATPase, PMCA-type [Ruminococcus sp. OA3]MCH1984061.1 calcium-translocating P-type ATPase, PMCA-type [Ruminococcus sp. OA3]